MHKEILVIDDNPDIRFLICKILKEENFIVRSAANYDQAVIEINKKLPDLAIIDIKLDKTDKDGIDLLESIISKNKLIPVIMIFSVGDFSAMIAVVLYAIVPAIRYTDNGLRQVPQSFIDVATTAGCTKFQILRRIKLPLSLPDIMLGVNQTLMMGLSMLVITSLVGTRDLGQETLIALSKVDPGRGLTAGICVAFIAITVDRLINAWSYNRKLELGLN